MSVLEFDGLRVDTPATHLAALGLLRAIDRHGQPARMAWRFGYAMLDSTFATVGELAGWLAEGFAPVPIVAPWQKGGCYRDATKSPRAYQLPLEEAARRAPSGSRLAAYRAVFEALDRDVLPRFGTQLGGLTPDQARKAEIIRACRAWLPDEAVPFVDLAAVLPDDDGKPAFGPALGATGGADGNQAIDTRYIRALTLLGIHEEADEARASAAEWAQTLLTGVPARPLPGLPDGLLEAGSTDEMDGAPGKVAFASNPWQTVLALEGMLLLAGSVHTRDGRGEAAFPWAVRTSARQDREGVVDLYLPEWAGWRDAAAVAELHARGRLRAGARHAFDVAAVSAAVRAAGPQLGVRRFQEFRLTKRRGGNPNLTAVGALVVPEHASDDTLLADLGPLVYPNRPLGGAALQLVRRAEQALRAPGDQRSEAFLAAARVLRAAETRTPDPVWPAYRLQRGWVGVLTDHPLGRLALTVAAGLRDRLEQVSHESKAQHERAERVLASPRPLVARLLDAPARPVLPKDIHSYGADLGLLLEWAREPDRWDEPLAALVALLRRSQLTLDSPPEPSSQAVGPWVVLAPIVLAAQPLRKWDAKPADEVLVTLRRVGIAAAYEAAVRRLHRLGVGVARIPVPGSSKPDQRLACALATPIHPQARAQLEAHLLAPTHRRDQ